MSSLQHERLGHLSKVTIRDLSKAGYIPQLSFSDHQFCEHCQYGKQVGFRTPRAHQENRTPSIWPIQTSAVLCRLSGASYFITFIDDSTRKVWAYLTRTKDRVFPIFKYSLAMIENQTRRKLKCLRSDSGGEYKADEFIQFYRERGIRQELMAPYRTE